MQHASSRVASGRRLRPAARSRLGRLPQLADAEVPVAARFSLVVLSASVVLGPALARNDRIAGVREGGGSMADW
jgi:hypothetical protein